MAAQYPSAAPVFFVPKNFTKVDLDGAIDSIVTTIPLVDASLVPTGGGFIVTDNVAQEIIEYAGVSGNDLTGCVRGADDSVASAHPDSQNMEMRWNAAYYVKQSEEINAISADLRNTFIADLDDTEAPVAVGSSLENRLDMIGTQLKAIINGTGWKGAVTTPLNTLKITVDGKLNLSGGVMTGDVTFTNNSVGVVWRDSGASKAVTMRAPTTIGTTYNLILPVDQGGANSLIINNGSGVLSFSLIANDNIGASAAIAYSKLALGTSILNSDINGSAGIAFSKMAIFPSTSKLSYVNGSGVIAETGWSYISDNVTTTTEAQLRFLDSTTNHVSLKANATTTTYGLTLPAGQGGASTFLQNNGSGVLTWATPAGSGTVNAGSQFEIGYYATAGDAISGSSVFKLNAGNDLFLTKATVGSISRFELSNTDNTNGLSNASIVVIAGGTSGGDAYFRSLIPGGGDWTFGADNSANDQWGVWNASSPGGLPGMTIDIAGSVVNFFGNTAINRTASGINTTLQVRNQSNSGASNALVEIAVGGTLGGDPITTWTVAGGNSWTAGVDNSDGDSWKLNGSTFIAVGSTLEINVANQILGLFGTAGQPTWGFSGQLNLGMYRPASGELGFATSGLLRWRILSGGGLNPTGAGLIPIGDTGNYPSKILVGNGTVSFPSHSFGVNSSYGMWYNGGNDLQFSANGVLKFSIQTGVVACHSLFRPDTAGTRDLGTDILYWGEINHKTIVDRGCVPWCDNGVELADGSIVSDLDAICSITKHPTKMTVHGLPMVDYSTFPKKSYKKAKTSEGTDGVEMTMMHGVYIGAFKEVRSRIETNAEKIAKLEDEIKLLKETAQ